VPKGYYDEVRIYDDASFQENGQSHYRKEPPIHIGYNYELWNYRGATIRLNLTNVGVAGNSNLALKDWSLSDHNEIHLLNDDIEFIGVPRRIDYSECKLWLLNQTAFEAEEDHGDYIIPTQIFGGALLMTREVLDCIGYMDTKFGRFGFEHIDYTNRAMFSGLTNINGVSRRGPSLKDGESGFRYTDVQPSVLGDERLSLEDHSRRAMQSTDYITSGFYRACRFYPEIIAGNSCRAVASA